MVRFHHLHVENRTGATLKTVRIRYKLMKGSSCFQEGVLGVEEVGPGAAVRSKSFIRDSPLFDRIEWVGDMEVQADPPIPREAITFASAGVSASIRIWSALGAALLFAVGLWLMFKS